MGDHVRSKAGCFSATNFVLRVGNSWLGSWGLKKKNINAGHFGCGKTCWSSLDPCILLLIYQWGLVVLHVYISFLDNPFSIIFPVCFVPPFFWPLEFLDQNFQFTNLWFHYIVCCFSWMIPNLYLGSGCCTKHPLKNGCLGFQAPLLAQIL